MEPFKKHKGRIHALDRADVDTDQIIPKQFLKSVERSGFGKHLFHDWIQSEEIELHPEASILVARRNFGCGSSREHAPWALRDFGFKVIVAPSFGDIFHTNCTKVGLLPIVVEEELVEILMEGGEATIDLERKTIVLADSEHQFEIDTHVRIRLMEGHDDIEITMQYEDEIEEYERR